MSEFDVQLVARARDGDSAAFDQLVRSHLRAAYAVALSALGDGTDAEDVCQDAFIIALERLEECRDPARFSAWLLRIVRNRAHNFRRYKRVRDTAPLDEVHEARSRDDPARDLDRANLRVQLFEALGSLPELQREIVLLHDMNGWRHREIAELLGLPEGTVRAHLFYARRALRERLGSKLPES